MRLIRLAALALLPLGCSPPQPRCATTVLPDCAGSTDRYSDEACQRLDDAERRTAPTVDPARAPVVEAPAEGAVLPGATPATFRWRGQLARAPGGGPRPAPLAPPRAPSFLEELARWTTLVPPACAHCMPFSGVGYALTFRAGDRVLLRVEQSATTYTPDAEAWSRLRAAGGPIALTVLATRFNANQVTEGPFAPASPTTFTIAP